MGRTWQRKSKALAFVDSEGRVLDECLEVQQAQTAQDDSNTASRSNSPFSIPETFPSDTSFDVHHAEWANWQHYAQWAGFGEFHQECGNWHARARGNGRGRYGGRHYGRGWNNRGGRGRGGFRGHGNQTSRLSGTNSAGGWNGRNDQDGSENNVATEGGSAQSETQTDVIDESEGQCKDGVMNPESTQDVQGKGGCGHAANWGPRNNNGQFRRHYGGFYAQNGQGNYNFGGGRGQRYWHQRHGRRQESSSDVMDFSNRKRESVGNGGEKEYVLVVPVRKNVSSPTAGDSQGTLRGTASNYVITRNGGGEQGNAESQILGTADWASLPGVVIKAVVGGSRKQTVASMRTVCQSWKYHIDKDRDELVVLSRVEDLAVVRERFPTLKKLGFNCVDVGGPTMAEKLLPMPSLQSLSLATCRGLTEKTISLLCESLKGTLTALDTSWVSCLDDACLELLSQLHKLKKLALSTQDNITDTGLSKVFNSLSNLTELELCKCTQMTDASLEQMGACLPKLTSLDLCNNEQLTFEGLAGFAGHKNLEIIKARWCDSMTCTGMFHLGQITSLKYLDIIYCRDMVKGWKLFGEGVGSNGLKRLEMGLDRADLGTACECLMHLNGVEHLELYAMTLNGSGMRKFYKLTGFEELKVLKLKPAYSGLTGPDVMGIPRLTSLEYLELDRCDGVDQIFLKKVGCHLPKLKGLSITYSLHIVDFALKELLSLTNLEKLNLAECTKLTDDGIRMLRILPQLRDLTITRVPITNKSLYGLKYCPKLERLDICYCDGITPEGLKAVVHVQTLVYIKAEHCKKLPRSDDLTDEIYKRAANPKLVLEREIWLPDDFIIPGD